MPRELGPGSGITPSEACSLPSRLLIRTASNAYFPQVMSVLSLPDRGSAVETVVAELWDDLQIVDDAADLAFLKKKPRSRSGSLLRRRRGARRPFTSARAGRDDERPVKQVELEPPRGPEGYGDDVPVDPDFHARRLPERAWRQLGSHRPVSRAVIQLHRLREVLALSASRASRP